MEGGRGGHPDTQNTSRNDGQSENFASRKKMQQYVSESGRIVDMVDSLDLNVKDANCVEDKDEFKPSSVMRPVQCTCEAIVEVPENVFVFQCAVCGEVAQIPRPMTEEEKKKHARRALNRWIVRQAVSKELDSWLDGNESFEDDSQSIVARFFRKLKEFPLFKDKSSGIDEALLDLFKFLPVLEQRLSQMSDRRASVRRRFVNYIAGPIFYATYGDGALSAEFFQGGSRGEKNDAFKAEFIRFLEELEKPDGVSTLLESIESAHSIAELPETFQRMAENHKASSVANLEHSLAKPRNRSKLKSLYRLTPRNALIKLMKLRMGSGVAYAAINLFMARPFGRKSIMQRMAATSLGVSDAEEMTRFAAQHLSPEVQALCDAYIAHYDGDAMIDIWFATDDEILDFLANRELAESWSCELVDPQEVDRLRNACKAFLDAKSAADDSVAGGQNFRGPNSEVYYGMDEDRASETLEGSSGVEEVSSDDETEIEIDDDGGVHASAAASPGSQSVTKTSSFFKKKKAKMEEEGKHHPLQYIRMYCYEEMDRQIGNICVELLGDKAIDRFVRVSLPVVQRYMIQSVTTKGSGLIPLMEGLFAGWKRILQVNRSKSPLVMKRAAYREVVENVHELTFTLIHNLARSDQSNTWHELVYWVVDLYNSSRLDVDTDAMIQKLSEEDAKRVVQEEEKLRVHMLENSARALGSKRLEPPKLTASWNLVEQFRSEIVKGLLQQSATENGQREAPKAVLLPKRLRSRGSVLQRSEEAMLTHIEIVYSYEDSTSMRKRGYGCLQVDFNISGSSDTMSMLWARRSLPHHGTTADGTELSWMKPITDIRIVEGENDETEAFLRSQRFSKVAKALDKRGIHLWYSRSGQTPIRNITAIRMDSENVNLRQQALKAAGYSLLAPIIRSSKSSTFFSSGNSKAAIGIYLLR